MLLGNGSAVSSGPWMLALHSWVFSIAECEEMEIQEWNIMWFSQQVWVWLKACKRPWQPQVLAMFRFEHPRYNYIHHGLHAHVTHWIASLFAVLRIVIHLQAPMRKVWPGTTNLRTACRRSWDHPPPYFNAVDLYGISHSKTSAHKVGRWFQTIHSCRCSTLFNHICMPLPWLLDHTLR